MGLSSLLLPALLFGGGALWQHTASKREAALFPMPGKTFPVPGAFMHIYAKGSGPRIVLLSGWGTSVPSADFQPLMNELAPHFRVIVVEKPGYGFSSSTTVPRALDTVVDELRAALTAAEEFGPYYLLAHSMAGCEAVRWACSFPEEVKGIVMLDAPAPLCYETLPIPPAILWHVFAFFRAVGIRRLLLHFPFYVSRYRRYLNNYKYLDPGLLPLERAMQARQYCTLPMRQEMRLLRQNCRIAGGKTAGRDTSSHADRLGYQNPLLPFSAGGGWVYRAQSRTGGRACRQAQPPALCPGRDSSASNQVCK